jgi:hypothetical protein
MIRIEQKGDLVRALAKDEKQVWAWMKRAVEMGASVAKSTVEEGDYFDDATPMLQKTLWVDRQAQKNRAMRRVWSEAGWGVKYGPVLEFGPLQAKSGWWIRAKKASFLRFRIGNKFYRKRQVWHPWDQRQLRPHWEDGVEKGLEAIQEFDKKLKGQLNG